MNLFLGQVGNLAIEIFSELGGIALFFKKVVSTFWRSRGNGPAIAAQIVYVSSRTFSTVAFAGIFVGAILVLQFNEMLLQYDAQTFLGGLNTSAVMRQVGPLIISFLLAGKVGAYTAAELGTMRVTEQIDAIECLGTDSLQYLVVPRFIGIVVSGVLLLLLGLVISILGSMLLAQLLCGVNFLQYLESVPRFIDAWTIAGGILQSILYSTVVALVACYKGYTATGGARGVGRAVTQAAIFTNLYIVMINYFSSELITYATEVAKSFLRLVGLT